MVNTIVKKITVGVPIRGVTSGAFAITNLGGVDVAGVGEGDMLVYDASQSKFIADSDTYIKTTDSAEIKAMFSAGGDLTYSSSTGQFTIDVEAVYSKANFDSDLDAATAAGSITFNDGTASLPSIANTGDTNTGFHFPAADTIGFTVGGASQFTLIDGVIAPVTDNDVDLGTSSLEFKDLYLDGTAHIDTLDVDANATIAGTLDVTGVASATTFEPDGDTAAGDNAAIGYTAAEGLILTGQGSTGDITLKNDADAVVVQVPTGTTNVNFIGNIDVDGITNLDVVDIDGAVNIAAATTMATDNKIQFRDTAIYIQSGQDGHLDLVADTELHLTSPSINVDGAANISGALVSGQITANAGVIVDSIRIDGTTIGHADDTDLITLANGLVTVAGEISVTTLDIGGTNVAATAAELNIMDGGTSASSTTVADGDRVVLNDDGTMKQIAVTDLAAYFDDEITAMPNLVSTGALDTGSITSGFGTINTGASAITTTGLISGGSLDIDNVLINGTTIGHTDDTDLITLADGLVTVAGEISVTTLDIGGTNVAATAAELNIMDGDTSATSTTVADGDRVVFNDAGTMKQVAVTDLSAYFDDKITAMPNLVSVGNLNDGNITSGFGSIDIGSSTIASGAITSAGVVTATGFTIGSAVIGEAELEILDGLATTTAELTVIDGDTSASSITVADGDRVVMNDNGTMKQVAVTDLSAYFDDEITAMPNLVTTAATTVGALNSGSITSGFGAIDIGSSTFTTTGTVNAGSITLGSAALSETELEILDGANITTAELNIIDGGTSASSVTVADADRVVFNDDGTMKQVAVTDLAAYFDDEITAMPNLVTTAATTVGALNSGSITSGFGNINTGASTITTTGVGNFGSLDISGNVDIDGTTNLDIVDIDDAVQIDGTVSVGVNDTGYDVKFFGDAASAYMLWDASADDLILGGAAGLIVPDSQLTLGSTAVTSTAAELNLLDGVSGLVQADFTKLAAVDATAAELNIIDGDTSASSVTVVDADRVVMNDAGTMKQVAVTDLAAYFDDEITAMPNLVSVGALNAGSITSGFTSIDVGAGAITTTGTVSAGRLQADNIRIDGNAITSTAGTDLTITPVAGQQIVLDGTIVVDAGVVTGATSITSTAFVGGLTGNVTGNTSGTALTVTQAAQSAITSLGTLTTLTVDNIIVNGTTIGHTSDTDAISIASDGDVTFSQDVVISGGLTVTGTTTQVDTVTMNAANAVVFEGATADEHETTLTIIDPTGDRTQRLINQSGYIPLLAAVTTTAITSTPAELNILDDAVVTTAELNILDGGTSASSVTVADADRLILNDAGTMKQIAVTSLAAYLDDEITAMPNLISTGALNTGSITSGFGSIDVGSSAITTTGTGTIGNLVVDNFTLNGTELDLSSGDFTLDVAGDIILDADGGEVLFHDNTTAMGHISMASSNITLKSLVSDKDIIFQGNDGGSAITALTLDMSGAGAATFNSTITATGVAIANDGNIGSAGDADAIAISSSGVVTFSQNPVFPDGGIAIADLDIDGGTDIGAALADADLFIVDDGAGGTNRKVAASRLSTYISTSTLTALTVDDVAVNGKVITMTGSSSDTAVFTAGTNGTLTIVTTDASAAAANITITADGTAELAGTTVTLNSGGDISLNADGAEILFDDGSTNVGHLSMASSNVTIKSLVSDKDIIFQGNDGGSGITALTLDMSAAGNAAFNADVTVGTLFKMPDNTSTKFLVADGTSYQEVAMSGDATMANTGAVTIASTAIESGMLNNNVISGQTALTSGLALDDEIFVSDGGVLKRMDISVLTAITDDNATALAIALG